MRVLLAAGEKSGFLLGDLLAKEMRKLDPTVAVENIKALRNLTGTLGFCEGVRKGWRIRGVLRDVLTEVKGFRPRVVVLIAFSGVNLFLGKKLRQLGIPVVYLAPPQVWAWGAFRVRLLRQSADRVVCLFKFEEGLLSSIGINAVYYGYPLLDSVRVEFTREQTLSWLGFPPGSEYVVFFPGSRFSEIKFHQPLFTQVFLGLRQRYPTLKGVMVGVNREMMKGGREVELIPFPIIGPERRYEVLRYARLAILVSGTATAESAILGTPAIACYHLAQPTRFFAKVLVKVKYFSIPNILLGFSLIPEFLEPRVDEVLPSAYRLLEEQSYREEVRAGLLRVKELLGPPGAMAKIAEEILQRWCQTK